jgi:hypothetical protein
VPAENGIGFDDGSDFLQGFLPQLLTDLRQGFAFAVTQPDAPCNLVATVPVIYASKCFQSIVSPPQLFPSILPGSMGKRGAEDKPKWGR